MVSAAQAVRIPEKGLLERDPLAALGFPEADREHPVLERNRRTLSRRVARRED